MLSAFRVFIFLGIASSVGLQTAWGQSRCESILIVPGSDGRGKDPEIIALSHVYDPFLAPYFGALYPLDGQVEVEYTSSANKGVHRQILTYQAPMYDLRIHLPTMEMHDEGLDSIYSAYGPDFEGKILSEIQDVEKYLPVNRQASVVIFAENNQENVFGFFGSLTEVFIGAAKSHIKNLIPNLICLWSALPLYQDAPLRPSKTIGLQRNQFLSLGNITFRNLCLQNKKFKRGN